MNLLFKFKNFIKNFRFKDFENLVVSFLNNIFFKFQFLIVHLLFYIYFNLIIITFLVPKYIREVDLLIFKDIQVDEIQYKIMDI